VRIVSWNMNHCMRSANDRTQAWKYLRDDLRADLALVQEASPPQEFRSVYRAIDKNNPRLNWGSAVVAVQPDVSLSPRTRVPLADCYLKTPAKGELPDSHPGACAVADVSIAGKFTFTAVSLYGQWEEMPGGGPIYACARLHRMISDLTNVFATSRRSPVVLAGDLNVTTQIAYEGQTQVETDGAAAVFARLQAWGLTNCLGRTFTGRPQLAGCTCPDGDACSHVQTFRLKNHPDSRPTQLDYAFASQPMVSGPIRSQVVHDDAAWRLSDHCPIILDFDEPH
jgi:exonuclease III